MPWWGDEGLAGIFAEQVGAGLGPLGDDPPFSEFGPLFAFVVGQGDVSSVSQLIVPPADSQGTFITPTDQAYRFAMGRPLAPLPVSSVPGPLPILGLGLGYG